MPAFKLVLLTNVDAWIQQKRSRIAIVYDDELIVHIGALRMRINLVRHTVSRPASVGNADVCVMNGIQLQNAFHCAKEITCRVLKKYVTVALTSSNFVFQSLHFAAFFNQDHAIIVRGIDTNTLSLQKQKLISFLV